MLSPKKILFTTYYSRIVFFLVAFILRSVAGAMAHGVIGSGGLVDSCAPFGMLDLQHMQNVCRKTVQVPRVKNGQ